MNSGGVAGESASASSGGAASFLLKPELQEDRIDEEGGSVC